MTYRHTTLPIFALEKQYQKFENAIIANNPSTDYTTTYRDIDENKIESCVAPTLSAEVNNKQLLDKIFVTCRIINVEVRVMQTTNTAMIQPHNVCLCRIDNYILSF